MIVVLFFRYSSAVLGVRTIDIYLVARLLPETCDKLPGCEAACTYRRMR